MLSIVYGHLRGRFHADMAILAGIGKSTCASSHLSTFVSQWRALSSTGQAEYAIYIHAVLRRDGTLLDNDISLDSDAGHWCVDAGKYGL